MGQESPRCRVVSAEGMGTVSGCDCLECRIRCNEREKALGIEEMRLRLALHTLGRVMMWFGMAGVAKGSRMRDAGKKSLLVAAITNGKIKLIYS